MSGVAYPSPIIDPRVRAVLDRLHEPSSQAGSGHRGDPGFDRTDPFASAGTSGPSLALQVFEVVAPQLRVGAFVMDDNGESDYLEVVRDPASGFRSLSLPLKGSTELSVKVE